MRPEGHQVNSLLPVNLKVVEGFVRYQIPQLHTFIRKEQFGFHWEHSMDLQLVSIITLLTTIVSTAVLLCE